MEGGQNRQQGNFFHQPRLPYYQIKPNYYNKHHGHRPHRHEHVPTNATTFDQKRLKNNLLRRTVDYNASVLKYLQTRIWQRDYRDARMVQPDHTYVGDLSLPHAMLDNPINSVTTRFVRTSTNKVRCPIFCVVWTPEGRRLVTGASSGEFTLWNGLTFNFETILQAHEYAVRTMTWSHNDMWLLTGDDLGYVKYWQSNMNNVQMYQAHKDQAIRCASFAPFDSKFCTCSDDGTVRIWDFLRCHEEKILRGHGADVRCVEWHPHKSMIVSGSKDSQQPVKLWDPRSGESLATLHAHKSTVMSTKWNANGNWLLTASRDHLVKLFDIRMMKEMYTFRGHKKEATAIAWHPIHENMFVSGGSDGGILFWQVGNEKEVGGIEEAHESIIWGLAWHPLGHMLCSGSNDHSTKFWTRNRPGDKMRDRYNLNTLPIGTSEDLLEFDDDTSALPVIPGMGLEYGVSDHMKKDEPVIPMPVMEETLDTSIPGLDSSLEELERLKPKPLRKVPYARPVPQTFQDEWEANKAPGVAPNVEEERRKKKEEEEKKKKEEDEKRRKENDLKRAKDKAANLGLVNIPDFGGNPIEVVKFIAKSQGPHAAREALVNVIQSALPSGTVLPIIRAHQDPIQVLLREGHIPPHFAEQLRREGMLPPPGQEKEKEKERPPPRKDKALPAHIAKLPIAVPPPKKDKAASDDGKEKEKEKEKGGKQGLLGAKPGLLPEPPKGGALLPKPAQGGLLPSPAVRPPMPPVSSGPGKPPLIPSSVEAQSMGDVDLRQGQQFGDVDMRQGPGLIGAPPGGPAIRPQGAPGPGLIGAPPEQRGGPGPGIRPQGAQEVQKRNGPMIKPGANFGQDRDERAPPVGGGDVDFRQTPPMPDNFNRDQDLRQGPPQNFNGPSNRNFERQQPSQDMDDRRMFPPESRLPHEDQGNMPLAPVDQDMRGPPIPLMSLDPSRTHEPQDQDFRQDVFPGDDPSNGGMFPLQGMDFDERQPQQQLPLMDQEEFPPLPHRKRQWEEGPGEQESGPGFGGPDGGGGRGRGQRGRGGFGQDMGRGAQGGSFRGRGRGWSRGRGRGMW